MYKKHEHVHIFGYSDSSYTGDKGDRKFTTGYCTFVGGILVTWRSKKQDVIFDPVQRLSIKLWIILLL